MVWHSSAMDFRMSVNGQQLPHVETSSAKCCRAARLVAIADKSPLNCLPGQRPSPAVRIRSRQKTYAIYVKTTSTVKTAGIC
jgi:hypothetical protein